jgi:long-chain fatty acid transport protein
MSRHRPETRPSARLARSLTVAVTLAFATTGAQAAGFQIKENSVIGLGRAFAGSGAAPGDAAVIANNPAAMSLLEGYVAQADLSLVDLSVGFDGGGEDAIGAPLSGSDGGDAGDLSPVPAAYFSAPLGDRFRVGVSLTAPFGLKTEYDEGWVGRYNALTSDLRTIDLGLALSWEVTDTFSLGGSAIYQYADAELSNAVDFGAILAAQGLAPAFLPQSADGKATIEGDDYAWGWTIGGLWRIDSRINIGFNYRSEIEHELTGTADFSVPANAAAVFAGLPGNLFTDTGGRAELSTPAVATLSGHWQATDRVSLMADIARTYWDSFENITVRYENPAQPDTADPQNWRNTWFTSLGADVRLDERWTLRGGIAYDQTPTQLGFRTPRVPDTDRRWLSLGASFAPTDAWLLSVGYSRIFSNEPEISLVSATGSTLQGNAKATTNLFAASAAYRF